MNTSTGWSKKVAPLTYFVK